MSQARYMTEIVSARADRLEWSIAGGERHEEIKIVERVLKMRFEEIYGLYNSRELATEEAARV